MVDLEGLGVLAGLLDHPTIPPYVHFFLPPEVDLRHFYEEKRG